MSSTLFPHPFVRFIREMAALWATTFPVRRFSTTIRDKGGKRKKCLLLFVPYASLAAVDLKLCVILTNVGERKSQWLDIGNRVTCVRVTVATASNNKITILFSGVVCTLCIVK